MDVARTWAVLAECLMRAHRVVVARVALQEPTQMPFTEHDHLLEALAPDRADEPLRERVLPGARGRRQDFADPHAPDSLPKHVTVDAVAIVEQIGWRGLVGEVSTTCWAVQAAVGCSVTAKWRTRWRWWASTTRTKSTRKPAVGTVKKSRETRSRTWLVRNVRQVWEVVRAVGGSAGRRYARPRRDPA